MDEKPMSDKCFAGAFNIALATLGSAAAIEIKKLTRSRDVVDLPDDDGEFAALFTATASPQGRRAAYRLCTQVDRRGRQRLDDRP
ncbi:MULTISPECIES: hypothetical protein [Sphingomonadaceae]|uniref:hypothetical protein n=1 Tax=Sphingomonadales TaxID=204457 RepID=UPI0007705148|nr:hypothetical protein [Sphingobium sp. TKS]AMK23185.1 hypothetical protein K426_11235 [Sphingobium sp. TKS]MCF8707580.1 hypothetical protein [Rhizorhapis sp. SPR117]